MPQAGVAGKATLNPANRSESIPSRFDLPGPACGGELLGVGDDVIDFGNLINHVVTPFKEMV